MGPSARRSAASLLPAHRRSLQRDRSAGALPPGARVVFASSRSLKAGSFPQSKRLGDALASFSPWPPRPSRPRKDPTAPEILFRTPPAPRGSEKRMRGSPGRKSRDFPRGCSSTGFPHPGRSCPESRQSAAPPAGRRSSPLQGEHIMQGIRRRIVVERHDDLSAVLQQKPDLSALIHFCNFLLLRYFFL